MCKNLDTVILYVKDTESNTDMTGLRVPITWQKKLKKFLGSEMRVLEGVEDLEVICLDKEGRAEEEEEYGGGRLICGDDDYFDNERKKFVDQEVWDAAIPTIQWFKERAVKRRFTAAEKEGKGPIVPRVHSLGRRSIRRR